MAERGGAGDGGHEEHVEPVVRHLKHEAKMALEPVHELRPERVQTDSRHESGAPREKDGGHRGRNRDRCQPGREHTDDPKTEGDHAKDHENHTQEGIDEPNQVVAQDAPACQQEVLGDDQKQQERAAGREDEEVL